MILGLIDSFISLIANCLFAQLNLFWSKLNSCSQQNGVVLLDIRLNSYTLILIICIKCTSPAEQVYCEQAERFCWGLRTFPFLCVSVRTDPGWLCP